MLASKSAESPQITHGRIKNKARIAGPWPSLPPLARRAAINQLQIGFKSNGPPKGKRTSKPRVPFKTLLRARIVQRQLK